MAGAASFLWQGRQGWAQDWPSPFCPCTPRVKVHYWNFPDINNPREAVVSIFTPPPSWFCPNLYSKQSASGQYNLHVTRACRAHQFICSGRKAPTAGVALTLVWDPARLPTMWPVALGCGVFQLKVEVPGCFQPAGLSSHAPAADLEEGAEPGARGLDASSPAPLLPAVPSSLPSSGLWVTAAEGKTKPLNCRKPPFTSERWTIIKEHQHRLAPPPPTALPIQSVFVTEVALNGEE